MNQCQKKKKKTKNARQATQQNKFSPNEFLKKLFSINTILISLFG